MKKLSTSLRIQYAIIPCMMLRLHFRFTPRWRYGVVWLWLGMMLPSLSILHAQTGHLPELGEAASRFLSPDQEDMIGKRFFRQLRKSPNYIADPELRHYLNTLGRKIGSFADLGSLTLHFNFIQENQFNAFAVPGGYVTFNSGLLLATDSESELAAIVGHEIAHISQRHLPRLMAKRQAGKLPTIAAVLASILVGGQAGVAGATLANATYLSNQLSFTREFEREADAIGIELMAKSGFDPRATASVFAKLQQFSLLTQKDLPEYLRTHPLSYTRVAEAEARINALPEVHHDSSPDFYLARARMQALYGDPQADTLQILEDRVNRSHGTERMAWRFGLSLALMNNRQFNQAMTLIDAVMAERSDLPQILAARAEILRQSGDLAEAVRIYGELVERYPRADYLRYAYLDILHQTGQAEAAKKIARHQLRRQPEDYEIYPLLSQIMSPWGCWRKPIRPMQNSR